MARKYPAKMFWFHILMNFLFHFFYLLLPGMILCIIGIWVKPCLWIGVSILLLDLVLSIIEQLRIRKTAITPSDNPEFNEMMDAFCGPDGLAAVKEMVDKKITASNPVERGEKS